MTGPGIKIEPGVKIGTFARAEEGGQIIMDGTTLRVENATVGKMFDANTGGSISAKGFTADLHSSARSTWISTWIRPILITVAGGVSVGVVLAVIKGWLPGL